MALHNTNSDKLLPVWERLQSTVFKIQGWFFQKELFSKNGNHLKMVCSSGNPLTVGSLRYWANSDDPEKYNRVMVENLGSQIEKSIDKGPEAHHLIGLVISQILSRSVLVCGYWRRLVFLQWCSVEEDIESQ